MPATHPGSTVELALMVEVGVSWPQECERERERERECERECERE